jgi:ParB family chromosome partitioning protein
MEIAMTYIDIPLDKLFVSPLNARKDLAAGQEDASLEELASSIRQQGLLSPLIVRSAPAGRYEVLAGQRRLLACRKTALDPIPCIVREDLDETGAMTLSLAENVHRADMHPLDKARALKALYDHHGSYERAARVAALSPATVRTYVQLLNLPQELQQRLGTASGSTGVRTLARLASTFSGDEAIDAHNRISGFNQRVQDAILQRSEGDIDKIDDLIEEAQEGAFDVRRCGGAQGCEVIRDIVQGRMSQSDFQERVCDGALTHEATASDDERLREATLAFWKALAAG